MKCSLRKRQVRRRRVRLRVAHVVPALFDERIGIIGGAERYAYELARFMARVTPTELLTFGDTDEGRVHGNLRVRVIGGASTIRNDPYDKFSPALFDSLENADVVHCHQIHATSSIMAAEFCRRTGRRVFVTDLGGGPSGDRSLAHDALFDAHLHISAFSQRLWENSTSRSTLISGGVDAETFHPANAPPADFRVIFVGRILPHKGIDVLIDAMPDDMQLDVIGHAYDARYFNDLESRAAGKRVSFITDLADNALPDAYRRSSCVVLPSVYRTMYGGESFAPELLGQTLLEGMASGLPAICTDVGAMPEVVVDGITGFVVPERNAEAIRDKLLFLRENRDSTLGMGTAGRHHAVTHFDWNMVVERCLTAYTA
ncbi:MAG TPA: glycosyltransferase family 4 protein [Gemmatimonadaceae bacterium]|nr:glycosyltransferase family 4 protein [Gemmatimonadaceae bacterium]